MATKPDELDRIFDKMGYTKNTDFRKDAIRLITDWHNKQIEEVLDRVEEKATEYYDWSKSLEKEVERPFMAVPLERIKKLRSEL